MQYIEQTITGIDGTTARFIGYVPDNFPEVVPDRTRPTVLIVPGGGYTMTSDREAEPIALQFLAADCNAFVLRYSCAPSVYPTALLEVAEAMRLILDNAEAWHVDPARIAVLGFSAGGHLAADFATSASDGVLRAHGYDPALLAPTALMLAYPVDTSGAYRHDGSFRALLGNRYGACDITEVRKKVAWASPFLSAWTTDCDHRWTALEVALSGLDSTIGFYRKPLDSEVELALAGRTVYVVNAFHFSTGTACRGTWAAASGRRRRASRACLPSCGAPASRRAPPRRWRVRAIPPASGCCS